MSIPLPCLHLRTDTEVSVSEHVLEVVKLGQRRKRIWTRSGRSEMSQMLHWLLSTLTHYTGQNQQLLRLTLIVIPNNSHLSGWAMIWLMSLSVIMALWCPFNLCWLVHLHMLDIQVSGISLQNVVWGKCNATWIIFLPQYQYCTYLQNVHCRGFSVSFSLKICA